MENDILAYKNISQVLTLQGVAQKKGRHTQEQDLGIVENATVVVDTKQNEILWLGPTDQLPTHYQTVANIDNCEGFIWIPELVECHTHLIYAGHRHHDYAMRCAGTTYQQIAAQGGGILSTLKHTRKASLDELRTQAEIELDRFQRYGVGAIEIKSGYGLTLDNEIKILECAEQLKGQTSLVVLSTFMPAHATPPEFQGRTDDYVDTICQDWIPKVAKKEWATFFDVFVEEGYFSISQAKKLCESALNHGFKIKLHVDQFKDLGGTALAVDLGATSCDHLDHVSDPNIKKIAGSDTVAVLLPGSSLFTGTPYPPARKLIDEGARVALSTDYNPGTCPSRNLPLMTTLACSQMKMTLPESIAAITYNAAAALGLEDHMGSLAVGKKFRVCQFKAPSYETLPYCFGELG